MKNKDFFYLQYNKINWENQEKTKINYSVNQFIIKQVILKYKNSSIKIFDIGFGIGFFLKMLAKELPKHYSEVLLSGCEPSQKNYDHFARNRQILKNMPFTFYCESFQKIKLKEKFNFVTAVYVFPHFSSEDLNKIAEKIHSLLEINGKFVLVVANETYLKQKLSEQRDLFLEKNIVKFKGQAYEEVLHYSDIPQIGKVIDYNREEQYYVDLFTKNEFKLIQKTNLNDNGFICTIFIFEKI